jgi:phage gpG-like protein
MKLSLKTTRDVLTPDLAARLRKAKNPTKALQAIGLVVVSMQQRAFTQPALRPSTWAPLKPATIKAKQAKGYGTKPLVSSGALAHSGRVVKATSRAVTVGSDRRVGSHSLAAIHQLGTNDGRIPARPTWPFDRNGKPTPKAAAAIKSAARRALDLERH